MSRYYLHLRDGTTEALDPEGAEYETMDKLKSAVLLAVRELLRIDVQKGVINFRFRVDAEDGRGAIVYSLPFDQAVTIIPPGAPH